MVSAHRRRNVDVRSTWRNSSHSCNASISICARRFRSAARWERVKRQVKGISFYNCYTRYFPETVLFMKLPIVLGSICTSISGSALNSCFGIFTSSRLLIYEGYRYGYVPYWAGNRNPETGKFEKGWYKVVLPSYKLISKHHYQEIYHYHEHEPELP